MLWFKPLVQFINALKLASGTVLMAENKEDLQNTLRPMKDTM